MAIGSASISDWLRKKQEIFLFSQLERIATQNQGYYEGAFNTPLKTLYSGLSLNGHLYKTNNSVKRPPRVGPCLSLLPSFDSLSDAHLSTISLRRTLYAGPKGVHVRESRL